MDAHLAFEKAGSSFTALVRVRNRGEDNECSLFLTGTLPENFFQRLLTVRAPERGKKRKQKAKICLKTPL
jgi:hypothetical protein